MEDRGRCLKVLLFSTSDFVLTFQKVSGFELEFFGDADYAIKATDKKPVSAGAIMCVWVCVLVL